MLYNGSGVINMYKTFVPMYINSYGRAAVSSGCHLQKMKCLKVHATIWVFFICWIKYSDHLFAATFWRLYDFASQGVLGKVNFVLHTAYSELNMHGG